MLILDVHSYKDHTSSAEMQKQSGCLLILIIITETMKCVFNDTVTATVNSSHNKAAPMSNRTTFCTIYMMLNTLGKAVSLLA